MLADFRAEPADMEVAHHQYADGPEVFHNRAAEQIYHPPKENYHVPENALPYPARQRRLFGLGLPVLCLIILLISAIVGLAVAAGVEGSRAASLGSTACTSIPTPSSSSSASSSSTSTPSSSSTQGSAPPAATVATDAGCTSNPAVNGTNYVSLTGGVFKLYCGQDFAGNDLLNLISPSFEACMEACASWNQRLKDNGDKVTSCTAVAFVPSWYNVTGQAVVTTVLGDCFLKKNVTSEAQLSTESLRVTDTALKL